MGEAVGAKEGTSAWGGKRRLLCLDVSQYTDSIYKNGNRSSGGRGEESVCVLVGGGGGAKSTL